MCERTGGDGSEILSEMAKRNCFFALDIGTESGDLSVRKAALEKALSRVSGELRACGLLPTQLCIGKR